MDLLQLFKIKNKNIDDELAKYQLNLATSRILAYTNRKVLLEEMKILVVEYASFLVNNQDREGIASRSEGAISESYIDTASSGLPANISLPLNRFKLLHVVKNK